LKAANALIDRINVIGRYFQRLALGDIVYFDLRGNSG
jgi:hypothetical protein